MKIVPTISSNGLKYKVVKKSFFRTLTLHEFGVFADPNDIFSTCINDELRFSTVSEAVKEIKKQFGDTAVISEWAP